MSTPRLPSSPKRHDKRGQDHTWVPWDPTPPTLQLSSVYTPPIPPITIGYLIVIHFFFLYTLLPYSIILWASGAST